MKKLLFPSLALVMSLNLTACNSNNETNDISQEEASGDTSQQEPSGYDRELVKFPENYDKGVNYTTVHRGNVREELYTSREAIEAVQNGQPIPSGTVITLEIYRDEDLDEIFVMEKRTGWGDQNPPDTPRNGDWLYQEFNGDRSLDYEEDIGRCFSCHANQERDDFVNSLDAMKEFDLGEVAQSKNSSTETPIAAIPTEHWKVSEISAHMNDSKDVNKEESNLIDDEEKAKKIKDVLLKMYLQQYKS
ncbi:cytochrome P460 family protein [Pseudalkalibacillus decolorationis]|uniref:cytochrome P460 family protein n=1 Tax=Pseudalkalibacillus decolorationis TaxID=163879 RepID=UPI0021491838|nr:cytochrome P460 family protein [Pseudalkalibacillus decolorationis]